MKKLVVAIDKDRVASKALLIETDERNEKRLAQLREQETHNQINDFKIDKVTYIRD